MKKLGVITVILIILLVSILYNPNNLGKNYYYRDDFEVLDLGDPYGQSIYKKTDNIENLKIFGDIIDYEYNRNYIIAKQKYNKEVEINVLKHQILGKNKKDINKKNYIVQFGRSPLFIEQMNKLVKSDDEGFLYNVDEIADSIITNSQYYKELLAPNKINYYIIDKNTDSVYGPFKKEEFNKFRKDKEIDLKFKGE